jgi:metal-responsive CopG/Arc/MetJ family transcriptional regulator
VRAAVSIPDGIYEDAERLAQRLGWSRSHLYAAALREFRAEHPDEDPVTTALNRLADEAAGAETPNVGRSLIKSGAWER